MSEIPCAAEHRRNEQPHRSGPGHENAIVRSDAGHLHRVQGDGRRFGQGRHPRRQGIGNPDEAVRRHRLVPAEGTPKPEVVRRGTVEADRGAAPPTRSAHAAPRGRIVHDPITGRPAGTARCGRHDARPLVAENGTRLGVALQHHVQVGPADAALGDLDEHLSGSRLRAGDLVDLDPAVADVDGCWHQLGWHGTHGRDISDRTLWPTQLRPVDPRDAAFDIPGVTTRRLATSHRRMSG